MDVQLIGANRDAIVTPEHPSTYYERYYLPSVGQGGTTAHTYQKITYHDIYPHIDWVFYFNDDGKLEHDFVVHPGGRPSDIKLQYGSAVSLQLMRDGIDHEREHSGVTTVYYNAHCQAQGEADPSNTFNIADSIDVSKTGDGLYQAN